MNRGLVFVNGKELRGEFEVRRGLGMKEKRRIIEGKVCSGSGEV